MLDFSPHECSCLLIPRIVVIYIWSHLLDCVLFGTFPFIYFHGANWKPRSCVTFRYKWCKLETWVLRHFSLQLKEHELNLHLVSSGLLSGTDVLLYFSIHTFRIDGRPHNSARGWKPNMIHEYINMDIKCYLER